MLIIMTKQSFIAFGHLIVKQYYLESSDLVQALTIGFCFFSRFFSLHSRLEFSHELLVLKSM